MKLIIDIPEKAYNLLQNEGVDWLGAEHILDAVSNGIPFEESEDCVSRQAVEDAFEKVQYSRDFCKEHHIDYSISMEMVRIVLHDLPPVTPTEKVWDWIPADQPPKTNGRYIVTRHFCNNDFVEMASYSVDLYKVDKYDFPKHKAGWYNYDSEYGHYEVDDIVAWMPSPESYKEI